MLKVEKIDFLDSRGLLKSNYLFLYVNKLKIFYFSVILDSSGYTKGYGFVRFGSEEEQRNALYAMNGYTGLGSKPLKICTAVPKPKGAMPQNQNNSSNSSNGYNNGAVWII